MSQPWLVQAQSTKFSLANIDDIAWAYTHVLKTTQHGSTISTEITLRVHTISESDVEIQFPTNSQVTEDALRHIVQCAPWALVGFDAQRKTAWDSKPARDQLVSQIVARREQLRQRSAP